MSASTPLWHRRELALPSARHYANPPQEALLTAVFTAPSGRQRRVYGFWDGGETWRIRFAPDELGEWSYATHCSDTTNTGLHDRRGVFTGTAPSGDTRFKQHGPIRLSDNRRHLAHTDGTPFFWLTDTAWAGPLLSTDADWEYYLRQRRRQGFNAVQWMATQTLITPDGDRDGMVAYTGNESIAINPAFFQRLDAKVDAMNRAGFLSVPVLLWAAIWSDAEVNRLNPGVTLPEDQAILLARYMVARWGADATVWILPGDGPYRDEHAARWKRIGQAVFGDIDHAPVTLHPNGMQWTGDTFADQDWFDFIGYQSGHGDDAPTVAWLVDGPPAVEWSRGRPRPVINLEPPYEDHIAYQSRQPFSAADVRKRLYWSLLAAPTAGVTYGGHGVWGWDDGTQPPINHPSSGIPKAWQQALHLPAAEQMPHLLEFFTAIDWWRLSPAPELIANQPGIANPHRHISAARSDSGDLAVIYLPENSSVDLNLGPLLPGLTGVWFNPATGQYHPLVLADACSTRFAPPATGDWLLRFR
jgi:hypothetical protein